MGIDVKEKTTHNASVGADAGQSIQKDSDDSIPASEAKRNRETENSTESLEEIYRKMQRMADPRYLHTLTMTELFQTSYKSRPPIIPLLYFRKKSVFRYFFLCLILVLCYRFGLV